ncbi:hypothetical protein IL306_011735, partial [Fusarium sp. DS 682]
MVMAVAYIHRKGLVHGDLHSGNFLARLPFTLDHLSNEKVCEIFGFPETEPVIREDKQPLPPGMPDHVVSWPIRLGRGSDDFRLSESQVVLVDFGTAFYPARESRYVSPTLEEIRPPESRFEPTTPLSFPSDIWTLAHTVFWDAIGQFSLLSGSYGEDQVTQRQVEVLGRLPDEWWGKWEERSQRFPDGSPKEEEFDKQFELSVQESRREAGME